MKPRAAAAVMVVGAFAIGLMFAVAGGAEAKPESEYLPAFEATYPAAVGSRIDSCTLCHNIQGSEYKLNSYARQWKEDENYVAINDLDADGDGYTNVEEIAARTFPGNGSDNPATVTTTTTVPGATTTTAAPGTGAAIYQAHCASCHGGGGGNLVPTSLSLSQIVDVVNSGRGSMPGYSGSLTSAEVQLVSEYLFNWAPAPTTTTTTTPGTPPPPPPNGKALYGASCAGCHGADGGDLAGTALSRSQFADITSNGTNSGMPPFRSTYTTAEIEAIADYVISLAAPTTTTPTTVPGAPPPTPPSGAAVYAERCAACHGPSGGDLVGRGITTGQISVAVNNGAPGMPGFSTRLSTAEVNAVVTYVAGKAAGDKATTTTTGPGSPPPNGATVYTESCAACHGASGGDLVGHSLSDATLASVTSKGRGSMPGFASRLNEAQINAVVAYLSSLGISATTPSGGAGGADAAGLYTRFCASCHGTQGGGGRYGAVAGTTMSRTELIGITATGRGLMPGYSDRMTAGEIESVADFVLAMGSGGEAAEVQGDGTLGDPTDILAVPDPATLGRRVFSNLCAACHGETGRGRGAVAAFDEDLDEGAIVAIIQTGGSRMPAFPELTNGTLDAVVAHTLFLATGEDPTGGAAAILMGAPGTDRGDPSAIHGVQVDAGDKGPASALAVVILGLLSLTAAVGYQRSRASRESAG